MSRPNLVSQKSEDTGTKKLENITHVVEVGARIRSSFLDRWLFQVRSADVEAGLNELLEKVTHLRQERINTGCCR